MKKVAAIDKDCVACGSCIKHCPRSAIRVHRGVTAVVDDKKCIGCGKCAKVCPAGVINFLVKEIKNEEALA